MNSEPESRRDERTGTGGIEPMSRGLEEQMNAHLQLDPADSLVLTIDLQRDYLDMDVATRPVLESEADRVVSAAQRLLAYARGAGIPVVHAYSTRRLAEVEGGLSFGGLAYILEGHELGLSQNAQAGLQHVPDRLAGSPQSEVHSALLADGDLHVTTKKSLDSFLYSDLDLVLDRLLRRRTLLIAGVNTDTCVLSTTFSAANRGYRPVVIRECTASMRGIDRHEMALTLMAGSMAWVLSLDEVLTKLQQRVHTAAELASQGAAGGN